jgi:hypothetical protein
LKKQLVFSDLLRQITRCISSFIFHRLTFWDYLCWFISQLPHTEKECISKLLCTLFDSTFDLSAYKKPIETVQAIPWDELKENKKTESEKAPLFVFCSSEGRLFILEKTFFKAFLIFLSSELATFLPMAEFEGLLRRVFHETQREQIFTEENVTYTVFESHRKDQKFPAIAKRMLLSDRPQLVRLVVERFDESSLMAVLDTPLLSQQTLAMIHNYFSSNYVRLELPSAEPEV